MQYAAHGALQAMKLGNGLWEHTNFNTRLQSSQIALGTASTNSSVLKLDYEYGTTANNGNLFTQTITIPGLTLTQTYTYDELNRFVVYGDNFGGGPGHVVNVVNQGGTVRFLDGQTGNLAIFDKFTNFRFLRTN